MKQVRERSVLLSYQWSQNSRFVGLPLFWIRQPPCLSRVDWKQTTADFFRRPNPPVSVLSRLFLRLKHVNDYSQPLLKFLCGTECDPHTKTQTQKHKHRDTNTHKHKRNPKITSAQAQKHNHTKTNPQKRKHANTTAQSHNHKPTNTNTQTQTRKHRNTNTQTQTEKHKCTNTITPSHHHTIIQTQTHKHKHTNTKTQTQKHTNWRCYSHTDFKRTPSYGILWDAYFFSVGASYFWARVWSSLGRTHRRWYSHLSQKS